MNRIEFWRDIPTSLGVFRLAEDTAGSIHGGWHHVGDTPGGGTEDTSLRDDLAEWVEDLARGESRPVPEFEIPDGPTFFRDCWLVCRLIPAGGVLTYRELATEAGRPTAIRAAAAAMRHNPTPLLVPCHRVVRTGGGLGGFAGRTAPTDQAVRLKRQLLELEGCDAESLAHGGILCCS